jgi:S-DNA-T family DNA segregation ATPase FtsK/SpoIIIE
MSDADTGPRTLIDFPARPGDDPDRRADGPGPDFAVDLAADGPRWLGRRVRDGGLDTSFEVRMDDGPPSVPEPVDDGEGIVLPDPDGEAYPVIPEHLRSLAGIGGTLGRHGRRLGHRAAFHGIRSPRYLLLAVAYAVAGVFRLAGRQLAWWWLSEQEYLRSHAAASGDAREWMRLHREVKDTRRVRGIILAGEASALLAAVLAMVRFAPWWAWLLAAAVAVPALARAGRPEDKPIISAAMTVPRFRVLNSDVVLRAYYSAGLGDPDKAGRQIGFESAMTRDGDGSRVRVILPYGTGFDKAVKALPDLASGLDVAPSQVYLTRDKTSHRRHTLWVADRDPLAIPAGKTPLLDGKARSVWQPAPFGLDERGRKVTLLLPARPVRRA